MSWSNKNIFEYIKSIEDYGFIFEQGANNVLNEHMNETRQQGDKALNNMICFENWREHGSLVFQETTNNVPLLY